jgi:hypothetical protein
MTKTSDNLHYLINTVAPFLNNMKSNEEHCEMSDAVLDFNEYIRLPSNSSVLLDRKITDAHNCGRSGCLAGWYTMLSEQDKRLSANELSDIQAFSENALADHFGIEVHEATALFGGSGDGAESTEARDIPGDQYDDYDVGRHSNELILDSRVSLAEELLEEQLDAEENPA